MIAIRNLLRKAGLRLIVLVAFLSACNPPKAPIKDANGKTQDSATIRKNDSIRVHSVDTLHK